MAEYHLIKEIIKLSEANIWDEAKVEWTLSKVHEVDEPQTCLCGHSPIIEICLLRNKYNGNVAEVGNCCVKKFIGLCSDKIFGAVKRVRKDREKSLNIETIEHAFEVGCIDDWERNFYVDVMRKRILTTKQRQKKIEINEKMIRYMNRGKLA